MKGWLWLALLAGCAGPADVQGTYTVAVTNRDNGCNFQSWTVGAQSTGVPVVITQEDASATADVQGVAGAALSLVLGGHAFSGTVDGASLELALQGTVAQTTGNCAYTYDGTIRATLAGDALSGRIEYTAATNGNSDCASIQGCVTFQDFNGSRPPE